MCRLAQVFPAALWRVAELAAWFDVVDYARNPLGD
jgi:hypothetical protein